MDIYVYADESGVFDNIHNDIFVFGGIILLGSNDKEIWSRKYSHKETQIRQNGSYLDEYELKATNIKIKERDKLYKVLNQCYKFGVVVNQKCVNYNIYKDKKSKQRYLDYAFKIGIKRAFEQLIKSGVINKSKVERIFFYIDEHSTATNGCYELRESLEQEFKIGTNNFDYNKYFPPIFTGLKELNLQYCNSKSKILIRAADITANRVFYFARSGKAIPDLGDKLIITNLP